MANSLKCDLCGKPATVHLTQIVNNKIHKVDLCEECAQAKGVTDPSGFSLADLLLKTSLNPEPQRRESAANSAAPPGGFQKAGPVWLSGLLRSFKPVIEPLLGNMHKGTIHVGKVPRRALERKSLYDRLTNLQGELTRPSKRNATRMRPLSR